VQKRKKSTPHSSNSSTVIGPPAVMGYHYYLPDGQSCKLRL
jgi:CBS domain-containing protein